jgi:plasmanylethanolamine desaturase
MPRSEAAPMHDGIGRLTRAFEILCLLAAAALLVRNIVRLLGAAALADWWALPLVVASAFVADLVSGIVHWTADTWGSELMPVIGRRFLRPFRVHHVNPDDFLRRDAIDCNGDVAMLNIPILGAALLVPLSTAGGRAIAVALVAFSAAALPTNQVHQWAHMPAPPRAVRWLQRRGLILSREAHARHHGAPYITNYCIATGWCNRWLAATNMFVGLERLVTGLTGWRPRHDEDRFVASLEAPAALAAQDG